MLYLLCKILIVEELCMSKYSHMMQTITAYKYSFRKLRDNTPIISGDGTLGTVNVKELLLGFS